MPSAVIFDCEGVLVDAEPLMMQAWRSLAEEWLSPAPPDDALRALIGRRPADAWPEFLAACFPHREFMEAARDHAEHYYQAAREAPLSAFPGVPDVVRGLTDRGIHVACTSPQAIDLTLFHLLETGLLDDFGVCVGGDEVAAGPPEPDLYRAAADRLGVSAADCIVVEDSPVGIAAGHAAGMRVIAVATSFAESELRDAHRVLPSPSALCIDELLCTRG